MALAILIGSVYPLTRASAVLTDSQSAPWPVPSDPQERKEYRLAHSLRLPRAAPAEAWDAMHERLRLDAPPAARPFNFWLARARALWPSNPSLAEQYYEHLCQAEAGEYIWRRVRGVSGIVQMRPRAPLPHASAYDWSVLEDPYGYNWGESVSPAVLYLDVARFDYFETRLAPDLAVDPAVRAQLVRQLKRRSPYYRYTRAARDGKGGPLRIDGVDAPRADYGFIWRGIQRPLDRELGIAGGEFLIVDRRDNSVLAMQRGFILRTADGTGATRSCPRAKPEFARGRDAHDQLGRFFSDFVRYVLHD